MIFFDGGIFMKKIISVFLTMIFFLHHLAMQLPREIMLREPKWLWKCARPLKMQERQNQY